VIVKPGAEREPGHHGGRLRIAAVQQTVAVGIPQQRIRCGGDLFPIRPTVVVGVRVPWLGALPVLVEIR